MVVPRVEMRERAREHDTPLHVDDGQCATAGGGHTKGDGHGAQRTPVVGIESAGPDAEPHDLERSLVQSDAPSNGLRLPYLHLFHMICETEESNTQRMSAEWQLIGVETGVVGRDAS